MRISFGPFAFDRQSRLLWRDGNEIALPPRVLGVLELLIDRAAKFLSIEEKTMRILDFRPIYGKRIERPIRNRRRVSGVEEKSSKK